MKKILSLVLCFSLLACSQSKEKSKLFQEDMMVMGTIVTVTIYGESEKLDKKLFHDLVKDFSYMDVAWNPYKKGSLRRINGLIKYGEPFSIGPVLEDMIRQTQKISRESDGYFNPGIGQLIKLWGFYKEPMPTGPPPDPKKIQELLKHNPSMDQLKVSALTLQSSNPNIQLDFGGFAKGYGVDRAINYLKSQGVKNAIINAGGDLRAIGKKGDKPWMIGIRDPRGKGVIAGIAVQGDESVFTSGDYERYYDYKGKRYNHIINPKTGYPADASTSVTVVNKNAALADAAATALFVAGPAHWEKIAKQLGLDQVMLIDNKGIIHVTPAIKPRLIFERKGLDIQVSKAF